MTQKEHLNRLNKSDAHREAVRNANSKRVWTEQMRNNLSNAMKESYKKRKKTAILNG